MYSINTPYSFFSKNFFYKYYAHAFHFQIELQGNREKVENIQVVKLYSQLIIIRDGAANKTFIGANEKKQLNLACPIYSDKKVRLVQITVKMLGKF